jgi:FkbH-like protein
VWFGLEADAPIFAVSAMMANSNPASYPMRAASTQQGANTPFNGGASPSRMVKCVVWDLDNTIWSGVLLDAGTVTLRSEVMHIIRGLDERGILNSIASRNDRESAMAKLVDFGIQEYFLAPQIAWGSKVQSLKIISETLNIGIDALAFVDDEAVERDEMRSALPEVLCIDAADAEMLLQLPETTPAIVTRDAALRRRMYLSEQQRRQAEEEFVGPKEDFLAGLGMVVAISPAREDDLARAEELTIRTHQLNATGYTYSYEELDRFRCSPDHLLLIAELTDRYGPYGAIGLALVECRADAWTLKLLLMSCRVMSRGIGSIMISHVATLARRRGVRLFAEFVKTSRNRMMYLTYKWTGFCEIAARGGIVLFEHSLKQIPPFPGYAQVEMSRLARPLQTDHLAVSLPKVEDQQS